MKKLMKTKDLLDKYLDEPETSLGVNSELLKTVADLGVIQIHYRMAKEEQKEEL